MKGIIPAMVAGVAIGAVVSSVYPMPISHRTARQIRRYVRRNAKNMMGYIG
ncbi:MAG: hypothetical protein Q8865_01615 [Bacillota bacterium]|nr:hypothetical protein [Bacillota bacterium]